MCYIVLIKKVVLGYLCNSRKKDDDDDVVYIDEDEDEDDEEDYVFEDCDDCIYVFVEKKIDFIIECRCYFNINN